MNVLGFINSTALRDHLEKIGYKSSANEAAWLVSNCKRATLGEKIAAWREIADTMPAEKLKRRYFDADVPPDKTISEALRDYIALVERIVRFVKTDDAGYVWLVSYREKPQADRIDVDAVFGSFETAFAALKEEVEGAKEDETLDPSARIIKKPLDKERENAMIEFNSDCEITDIYQYDLNDGDCDTLLIFDNMWFGFPTPFKNGDVVCDPMRMDPAELWSGPFVLNETATDVAARENRELCDSSDMCAWGYFTDEDGAIYSECMHDYTSLEYFPEEKLTGKFRVLKALSNHIKGKLDEDGVLFALAYHQIRIEEWAKDLIPKWITPEGLELMGIEKKQKELGG